MTKKIKNLERTLNLCVCTIFSRLPLVGRLVIPRLSDKRTDGLRLGVGCKLRACPGRPSKFPNLLLVVW